VRDWFSSPRLAARAISRPEALAVAALLALASWRIVHSASGMNQTYDEGVHLACGIEFLDLGVYRYEAQHPPLARLALSALPFAAGVRSEQSFSMWEEGNRLLQQGGYGKTLALARLGILPFFWLGGIVAWLWAKRLFGVMAGLTGLFLYTFTPSLLAHGSLATTDMAFTACFLAALAALSLFLEAPSFPRFLLLTVAACLALLSKFTFLLFFPAAATLLIVSRLAFSPPVKSMLAQLRPAAVRHLSRSLAVALLAFLLLWSVYGFSSSSIVTPKDRPHGFVTRIAGPSGAFHDWATQAIERPVPLGELVKGVLMAKGHVVGGHDSYLLGAYSTMGWWYFFPVTLAVKTPLPLLLAALTGLWALARLYRRQWRAWAPPLCAVAVLLSVLPASVNLGIRHILIVLPLMTITGALGIRYLFDLGRLPRFGGMAVLVWLSLSSLMSHPHYLSYFNELAGDEPARILVESDLDWGQDLKRLKVLLDRHGVPALSLGYYGSADSATFGLPPFKKLEPGQPVRGWIAISLTSLHMLGGKWRASHPGGPGAYDWLLAHKPVARAGKSILLYYVP
jgi:hypothetical protein